MAWTNPRWGSLVGPDADTLRGIFESISEWTRNPTFENATNATVAGGGLIQVQPEALVIKNEWIQSSQYTAGSAGWRIYATGAAEFNNVTVRGAVTGATITGGTISGTTITGTTISGGTISGTTISGVTVTGSSFSTATSGNRVHILTDGGVGFSRFYSGHANELSPGHVSSSYTANRSFMILASGLNNSFRQARIQAASGPEGGGVANLTFAGFDNGAVRQELDEHHYMGNTGVARWYGTSDIQRMVVDNNGVWTDSIRHTNGGAPGLMSREGNLFTFSWDGINVGIWVNNSPVVIEKTITVEKPAPAPATPVAPPAAPGGELPRTGNGLFLPLMGGGVTAFGLILRRLFK